MVFFPAVTGGGVLALFLILSVAAWDSLLSSVTKGGFLGAYLHEVFVYEVWFHGDVGDCKGRGCWQGRPHCEVFGFFAWLRGECLFHGSVEINVVVRAQRLLLEVCLQ